MKIDVEDLKKNTYDPDDKLPGSGWDKQVKAIHLKDVGYISICKHPTMNCQIFSIANVNYILRSTIENPMDIFKYLYSIAGKNLMLIDINVGYADRLENLFSKKDILVKTPYSSTNGSSMVLYLIKTTKLRS